MYNLLHQRRRNGLSSAQTFARYSTEQQCLSFDLASNVSIIKRARGGTLTLHVEAAEGRYLLSGSTDRCITIHDLNSEPAAWQQSDKAASCPILVSQKGHQGAVSKVTWYPQDSGAFVSSGTDGCVKLWDTNTMAVVEQFTGFDVVYNHALSVTPQQCLVAVACKHREVFLCDVRSGSKTHTLKGHSGATLAADWSPNVEHVLATGGTDKRILLWDVRRARSCLAALDLDNRDALATYNSTTKLRAHRGAVNCVQFTENGRRLVSSGGDDAVRVWDVDSAKHDLAHFPGIRNRLRFFQFALLERGRHTYLYHPNESVIGLYRLADGKLLRQLRAHYSDIYCLQLHPSRNLLLSGSNDAEVLAWRPKPEQCGLIEDLDNQEEALDALPVDGDADNWSD
eukprot:TRINITY_DN12029_c4_g1_i1.p1 TRINITY_DN12029_c4_g1~~TRINITY_DN12029_c4_g1_i1.p1  ORF type:complete len:397 (+),score=50.89 TRINITY_DN12029_c4_g1_i1:169-1359(+)